MSEKKVRITKAQRFEDIKHLLMGEDVVYGTTVEDAMGVIDHELDLLAKKNSVDSKKQTAAQQVNEGLKQAILDYLGGLPDDVPGATCTEMYKNIPCMADYSGQKVSALANQLAKADRVEKKEIKGKTYFALV